MVKVSVKLVFLFIILLGFTLAHSGIGQELKFSNDTLKLQQPDSLVIDDSPPQVFISPDFIPDVPYDLVGDRLSCIEKEIPLNYNSKVRAFIEYFAVRNREYTQRMINRKNLYFPIFEKIPERVRFTRRIKIPGYCRIRTGDGCYFAGRRRRFMAVYAGNRKIIRT